MKRLGVVLLFLFIFLEYLAIPLQAGARWGQMNISQKFHATMAILEFLGESISEGGIGDIEIEEGIYFMYNEEILYIATNSSITEKKMRYMTTNELEFKKNEVFDYIRIVPRTEKGPLAFDIQIVNFKKGKHTVIVSVPKKLEKKDNGFVVANRGPN